MAPNTCSYCGGEAKFTREHLLPKCLHERTRDYDIQYLAVAPQRLVGGEPTVRDVCRACNNNKLEPLDRYICQLWDKYFENFVPQQSTIEFEYEFDLLTRSLLKLCYNSARVHQTYDSLPLANCSRYILGAAQRPQRLAVFLRLVVPSRWRGKAVPPAYVRVAPAQPPLSQAYAVCRTVAFNSFHFYILLSGTKVDRAGWRRTLEEFPKLQQGSYRMRPASDRAVLRSSTVDAVLAVEDHLVDNWELYRRAIGQPGAQDHTN